MLTMLVLAMLPVQQSGAADARATAFRQAAQVSVAPSVLQAHLARVDGAFPRLANYNGFGQASDVTAYLHDAIVIAPQGADSGHPSAVQQLKAANPFSKVLAYERTLQVDYPLIKQMYGTNAIFPGWWLLRAGSVLTAPISARQTTIPVADPGRFKQYDDVLVGGESMHVLAITGNVLTVQRGFYSQAAAHRAGARIATHYSYRVDLRNTIITGRWENRRPWSFNLSSLCPRDSLGRTWADFLAERMVQQLKHGHWDGAFFDNTDDLVRDPWVDVNNDNVPDGGIIGTRNVWHEGEMYLLNWFRTLAPKALIVDNGTLDAGLAANGREMEGFPLASSLYMSAMSDYMYWQGHDSQPTLDLVNPDSGRSPRFDLNAMRYGLASALMGDGFYSYDEGWHRHGVVWNFDEYDDGAGTAVLQDIGAGDTSIRVRRTAIFHPGDILLVGREQMQVRDFGASSLIVRRGVNGTRATTHPAGSVVATPAQIALGSGYLGAALGLAYPILPAVHGQNLVTNGGFQRREHNWYVWLSDPRHLHVDHSILLTGVLRPWQSGRIDPAAMRSGLRDEQGFGIDVPWQTLRRPEDVSLVQDGIKVQPGTSYTLTFWAQGVPGMALPVMLTGTRASGRLSYAPFAVTLHQGWYRYVLRYTAPGDVRHVRIAFEFGRTYGHSAVTGVILQRGQALVYARQFTGGIAMVNQGDRPQLIKLPATYWHLRGDQAPGLNDGTPARSVWMPPHSGLILVRKPPS